MKYVLVMTIGLFPAVMVGGCNPFDRGPTLQEVVAAFDKQFRDNYFGRTQSIDNYRNLQCADAKDGPGKMCTFEFNYRDWRYVNYRFVKNSNGWAVVY